MLGVRAEALSLLRPASLAYQFSFSIASTAADAYFGELPKSSQLVLSASSARGCDLLASWLGYLI